MCQMVWYGTHRPQFHIFDMAVVFESDYYLQISSTFENRRK